MSASGHNIYPTWRRSKRSAQTIFEELTEAIDNQRTWLSRAQALLTCLNIAVLHAKDLNELDASNIAEIAGGLVA